MQIRTVHKLTRKDRLETLSARYRVPVCMIMRANDIVYAQDIGHLSELKIPCICYCNRCELTQQPKFLTYTVQEGDTLFGIARKHGITMKLLQKTNGLADPSALRVGEILKIPMLSGQAYSVRAGETLEDIALRSGICASHLREKNGLEPGESVFPGMQLIIG